jgi:hypothetical protein
MDSQIRFVMHPEDEKLFVEKLLAEEAVHLIDGPRWKSQSPDLFRTIDSICGDYCIIWSTSDGAKMTARYIASCHDWYCTSEGVTIQFLRSRLQGDVITEGRLAISVPGGDDASSAEKHVQRRFNSLRSMIKKAYTNKLARWCNPDLPLLPAAQGRSANPSAPDPQVWISPEALHWLRERPGRRIKQGMQARVEAVVEVDAV